MKAYTERETGKKVLVKMIRYGLMPTYVLYDPEDYRNVKIIANREVLKAQYIASK